MKNLFLLATICLMIGAIDAQTVRSKDSYGEKIAYIDGNTLRAKDSYPLNEEELGYVKQIEDYIDSEIEKKLSSRGSDWF